MSDLLTKLGPLWSGLDGRLRAINKKAKATLRWLRFGQFVLIMSLIVSVGGPIAALWYPQYAPYAYIASIAILSVGIIPLIILLGLPFKARSVVRLVNQGYPENARELVIRAVAQKMHEESIQTEELLFDTAINEGKKIVRRAKERANKPTDEEA